MEGTKFINLLKVAQREMKRLNLEDEDVKAYCEIAFNSMEEFSFEGYVDALFRLINTFC